jgi:hypothetical protein
LHIALQFMAPFAPPREFRRKLILPAKNEKIDRRLDAVGVFAEPLPGFGDGLVCIEVEDDTSGKSLEGRKKALRLARNIIQPFFV